MHRLPAGCLQICLVPVCVGYHSLVPPLPAGQPARWRARVEWKQGAAGTSGSWVRRTLGENRHRRTLLCDRLIERHFVPSAGTGGMQPVVALHQRLLSLLRLRLQAYSAVLEVGGRQGGALPVQLCLADAHVVYRVCASLGPMVPDQHRWLPARHLCFVSFCSPVAWAGLYLHARCPGGPRTSSCNPHMQACPLQGRSAVQY